MSFTYVVKKSDGSKVVRTSNGHGGWSDKSTKSSSSNHSSSSHHSSSSSSSQVYASRVPVNGGSRQYSVNGQWTNTIPQNNSSSHHSSSSNQIASNQGQTAEIIMHNTKTGNTTKTVQNLNSNKTISKTTTNNNNNIQQIQARERQTQQQSNIREELNQRIQSKVASEIRQRQKQYEYTQQRTSTTPLRVNNLNKNTDFKSSFVYDIGAGITNKVIISPLKGAKKEFYNQPNEISNQFKKTGFASQYGNYQQVVFGEQTPSTKVIQAKQNFDKKKSEIEKKYQNDQDVKTFNLDVAVIGTVYGGGVLAGVKGAGILAQTARGAGNTIKTAVDAVGVTYAGNSIKTAVKNPTKNNIENAIIGGFAGVAGVGGLKSTIGNQAARIGAKEVSTESVFNKQVLDGKQTFPTSKGPQDTYNKFKKIEDETGVSVIHATPSRNSFGKKVNIEAGPMGAANKEDAILFTTPKGEGSSHFLGVNGERGYSFNPFSSWKGSKPGAIEIKATGVKTLSGDLINTAKHGDFSEVNEFYVNSADKTAVYPTARSTLGHTSELEGGIPQGSKLISDFAKSKNPIKRYRGYDEYSVIDGKTIPIKKYQTIKDKTIKDSIVENANVKAAKQKTLDVIEYKKSSSRAINKPNSAYVGPRISELSSSISTKHSNKNSFFNNFSSKKRSSESSKNSSKLGYSFYKKGSSSGSSSPGRSSPGGSPSKGSSSGGSSSGRSSPGGSPSKGSSSGGSSSEGSSPKGFPSRRSSALSSTSNGFKSKQKAGYNIYIRENGKRIKTNKKPVPYNVALKQGENIIDNTVASSFEIQKKGLTNIPDIPSQIISNKFRERKTKNALRVVEKSKYRIDTVGEKSGLSVAKFMKRFRL